MYAEPVVAEWMSKVRGSNSAVQSWELALAIDLDEVAMLRVLRSED